LGVPGRRPAVACRVYVTSAGPSVAPPLGDVVVQRAAACDRGSASPWWAGCRPRRMSAAVGPHLAEAFGSKLRATSRAISHGESGYLPVNRGDW